MNADLCPVIHPDHWLCSLPEGHSGPHEARGTSEVLATWDNLNDHANDYAEGTPEWHAWGMGNGYISPTDPAESSPLSGEFAGEPLPHLVISAAWRAVMGPSWDTYIDGSEDDREGDQAILGAWESGARHAWLNR